MKKDKIKKESALKKKIKEMKKTTKGTAILKLIGWGIFFFIIFVFWVIASFTYSPSKMENAKPDNNITDQEEQKPIIDKEKEYIKLLEDLERSNYDYKYEITINDSKYIYNGKKENNIEQGYKESNNGIIKYYIDDTGIYEETTTNKIPITNLYENIEEDNLNINKIIEILQDKTFKNSPTVEFNYPTYLVETEKNIYYICYEKAIGEENNKVKMLIIKALDNTYIYQLTFNNVR